jgi:hypothetical protein
MVRTVLEPSQIDRVRVYHFLINIAPSDRDELAQWLGQQGLDHTDLYPVVRARGASRVNQAGKAGLIIPRPSAMRR